MLGVFLATTEVEVMQIDRKYESYRMRSSGRERLLLASIVERGIDEPVYGVKTICDQGSRYTLLDGFKRLRCAIKLGILSLKFIAFGEEEAESILQMIRVSNAKGLTLLEQAKLVDELIRVFGMNVGDVALKLNRSKSWVSVRKQVLSEMSSKTMDEILAGKFPLYSYMYTLAPFRRLEGSASKSEVEQFVASTAGKALSTREIDLLSRGYFQGSEKFRNEVKNGNLGWCLDTMKAQESAKAIGLELTELERKTLRDLEIAHDAINRLLNRLRKSELSSRDFFAEAVIITEGLIKKWPECGKTIGEFYDRCRAREGDFKDAQAGFKSSQDECKPKN